MRKIIFSTFLLLIVASVDIMSQTIIKGVKMPDSLYFASDSTKLFLNGAGVRNRYSLDMFVIGLYLPVKSIKDKYIIDANQHTLIKIQVLSAEITVERMVEAIRGGFDRSLRGRSAAFKKEIDMIVNLFISEELKVGDVFDISYNPTVGMSAKKNGVDYQMVIAGIGFKRALLGIWLGMNPGDESLKNALLGIPVEEKEKD